MSRNPRNYKLGIAFERIARVGARMRAMMVIQGAGVRLPCS